MLWLQGMALRNEDPIANCVISFELPNTCAHGTSTLQTDRRTDVRLTIAILRFALGASRGLGVYLFVTGAWGLSPIFCCLTATTQIMLAHFFRFWRLNIVSLSGFQLSPPKFLDQVLSASPARLPCLMPFTLQLFLIHICCHFNKLSQTVRCRSPSSLVCVL